MSAKAYLDLQEKHREELSNFPIAYAFDEKQLKAALEKLGAKDISECVSISGIGDIVKKENAPKFIAMMKCQAAEVRELILSDETVAMEAFLYEMDNHEYCINYDGDGDVLGCFNLEWEDLRELDLERAYSLARKKHFDHAREWGVL